MFNKKNSLYKVLSLIIIATVVICMFLYSSYNYIITKNNLLKDLKHNADTVVLQLKSVVVPFMESYSVNDYEKIVNSYMQYKDIYAILVEDYKTSEIIGDKKIFIVGKIKDKNWDVIDYEKNKVNDSLLNNSFYIKSDEILSANGSLIGKIHLYSSNKFVNYELERIILRSFVITALISTLLIFFLYVILNMYVLKPLSNIISSIQNKDKNGIPIEDVCEFSSLEVTKVSNSINSMMSTIRNSRKALEELNIKLKITSKKYQNFMSLASGMVFILDTKGNILEYSKRVPKKLGYTEEEFAKLKLSDWDKDIKEENIEKQLSVYQEEPTTIERIHTRKDGSTYIAEILVSRIKMEDYEYLYASVRDITQRKEIERIIQEQKEEFETIFNYSKDGIAILDLETNFLNFNEAYLSMTGFTKEELLTKSCIELSIEEDKGKSIEVYKKVIKEGSIKNFEKAYSLKDGKRVYINMSISLLPDKKRFLIVSKDTSSLKMIQEQTRLASMGEMIGNIAHQWRQPLSVITTNVSGMKIKAELDCLEAEDIAKCSDNVIIQANYLSKTIDNFRDFIKGDKSYKTISIKNTIEDTLNLLEASLNNSYINRIINIEDDLMIKGNKSELTEGFINIINNSKDALKNNINEESDRLLFIETKRLEENSLELKILDSGGGIPDTVINRIFEPYFSTKHKSQGTGLGLSMADKIIRERHNALIDVYNENFEYKDKKYRGACFKIVFKTTN